MVLIVWRFLDAIPLDGEFMRNIKVATVHPGLHRRLRYGTAIITATTLELRLWIDPVFVPIMGVCGFCCGDTHCREDKSSHGIPQVFGASYWFILCILAFHKKYHSPPAAALALPGTKARTPHGGSHSTGIVAGSAVSLTGKSRPRWRKAWLSPMPISGCFEPGGNPSACCGMT